MKRLILALLLLATPAEAAITFDTASTYTSNSSSSVAGSHTLGACLSSYVVVVVASQGTPLAISSITYGATSLASLKTQDLTSGDARIEIWGVKSPPAGAQTVTATLGGSQNSNTMSIRTYCGVDQSVPIGTAVSDAGTGETATIVVTSASNELVVDGVMLMQVTPLTVDASQTERANFAEDVANHTQGASEEAGAASVSMDWTWTGLGSNYWGQVGVPLKPATVVPAVRKRPIIIQ